MSRSSTGLAGMFAVAGTVHLAAPAVFDPAVPDWLPGSKRAWALGSGVAELACAALVAARPTRRLGGYASAALLLAVFPGNLHMAATARSPRAKTLTALRLPLQVPLVAWAWQVARRG